MEKKKVYILTCSGEYGNEEPEVFDSREKAENALEEIYNKEISNYDEDHELNLNGGYAYIVVNDQTINYDIWECEVK